MIELNSYDLNYNGQDQRHIKTVKLQQLTQDQNLKCLFISGLTNSEFS